MPGYKGKMTDKELEDVIAYIRTSPSEEPTRPQRAIVSFRGEACES